MKLLLAWVLNALALLAVANFITALIAAVFIGLANILIKPILTVLTLPITIITLGLFILVINGLLFYAVGNLLQGFEVTTFTAGIIGAIAYSIISWLLSALLIEKD